VICHKCSAVLYASAEELKSTDEIIQGHDGRCPNCGKKLSYIPKNIEVNPVDERIGSPVPEKKKPKRKKSWKKPRNVEEKGMRSYEPKSGYIWKKESI
jgi:predicted  nucleic acid-binding Zn-ribbon protein